MKSEQIKEITDRAAEQLVSTLQAGHSEALTMYLQAIGRFHRYSLHNVLLIASQKPNANYVAGFRTWNELGRFVKKGEKGIMILAPIVRRKAQNDDEVPEEISRPIAGFRAAFVFDISQTDGKELPQIGAVRGDPSECPDRLRRFASTQGIVVEYSEENRARSRNILRRPHCNSSRPVSSRKIRGSIYVTQHIHPDIEYLYRVECRPDGWVIHVLHQPTTTDKKSGDSRR